MINEVSLREEDYNEHGYSHAPVTVRSAPQQPNSDCGVHARWTTEMGTGGFKSRTAVVLSAHIIAGYPLIWTPRVLICGRLFTEGIYAITERQMWFDLRWVSYFFSRLLFCCKEWNTLKLFVVSKAQT